MLYRFDSSHHCKQKKRFSLWKKKLKVKSDEN
jgi:hypothetical protein